MVAVTFGSKTRRPQTELSWNLAPSWLALESALFPQPSRASTMATKPQESDTRDGLLFSLNAAIDALGLAREISMPAQAIFGSVNALLTMIGVCSLPFYDDGSLTHIYSGFHGQRSRPHQSWVALRRYLSSAQQGNGRKETGGPQSTSLRGDKPVNNVSQTNSAEFGQPADNTVGCWWHLHTHSGDKIGRDKWELWVSQGCPTCRSRMGRDVTAGEQWYDHPHKAETI